MMANGFTSSVEVLTLLSVKAFAISLPLNVRLMKFFIWFGIQNICVGRLEET